MVPGDEVPGCGVLGRGGGGGGGASGSSLLDSGRGGCTGNGISSVIELGKLVLSSETCSVLSSALGLGGGDTRSIISTGSSFSLIT